MSWVLIIGRPEAERNMKHIWLEKSETTGCVRLKCEAPQVVGKEVTLLTIKENGEVSICLPNVHAAGLRMENRK